jgi:GAF domain-containing protein
LQAKTGYAARSILYVPLKLRGLTLGVLGVSNQVTYRAFSKRDEFLLTFLGDYAAIALENARVFQAADKALARRVNELNTLIDITHTINSTLDLDEVVRLTIRHVYTSWDIEVASLWWVDNTSNSLRVLANVGTPTDILNRMEVPLGEGFVGIVAQTGKWIYTNDVAAHPAHYRDVDFHTGFQTHSLLCVPLLFGGTVVGAMQLLNKQGGFDDQDVDRALSIAAAVAIAVTNALRFGAVEAKNE